eukprot:COSAG02_NODE_2211_length_9495_cov_3.415842_5_plen_137_part_00
MIARATKTEPGRGPLPLHSGSFEKPRCSGSGPRARGPVMCASTRLFRKALYRFCTSGLEKASRPKDTRPAIRVKIPPQYSSLGREALSKEPQTKDIRSWSVCQGLLALLALLALVGYESESRGIPPPLPTGNFARR